MSPTIIDQIYKDNGELLKYLEEKGEISFRSTAEDNFRKTLVLAAASYFESLLTDSLIAYFSELSPDTDVIVSFVKNKAISRQYHTFFQWDKRNANTFFGLFGENFRQFIQAQISTNNDLDTAIRAFLELGELRNLLVHQNFANYPLTKTAEEIYELYQKALIFVTVFPDKLREYKTKPKQEAINIAESGQLE